MYPYYKKRFLYILSVTSGLLLSAGWPVNGFPFLLFVAFVPLLIIEDYFYEKQKHCGKYNVFGYSYIAFVIWNFLTTYWIINATFTGALLAFVFNSLFMAFVFNFFHYTRKKFSSKLGYLALPAYWISFEYLHLHWDLMWPWLNLGNGFSEMYKFVQWYEFTGVFGGSLWILVCNILIFRIIKSFLFGDDRNSKLLIKRSVVLATIIFVPIVYSIVRYYTYSEKDNPCNITIVQPNIDPYNEKFNGMTLEEQMKRIINLARQNTDKNTDFIIAPETAIPQTIWETDTIKSWCVDSLKNFIANYPKLKVVIGMSSARVFKRGEKLSSTARKFSDANLWYDSYNSAMFLDNYGRIQIYHKSKLVPGVEKMPYPSILKPLEKFAIDLGGTVGSLGIQEERTVFSSKGCKFKVAPVICYESVFGEFLSEYINNGANLIFIITNDGWWGNTPGYKQHCSYARLRSVELRRSIARSANTGISCFINQKGDILLPTKWWVPISINYNINANEELTFYAKHGDYIAKFFVLLSFLFLLSIIYSILSNILKKVK